MSPIPGRRVRGVVAVLAIALAACTGGMPTTPAPTTPSASGAAGTVTSPVTGVPVDIDAAGFSTVTAFTIRTDAGRELTFTMGTLENGAEFPPNHLVEHLAASTQVRVFFRREDGEDVVYRLEDAEPVP